MSTRHVVLLGVGAAGPAFAAEETVTHSRAGRLDRAALLALSAAQRALAPGPRLRADATPAGERTGVFVATQYGAFAANAEHWLRVVEHGVSGVSPLVFPATVPSAAAAEIAIAFSALGPNVTLCGGAEASRDLVALARTALLDGDCDEALVAAVTGWHARVADLGVARTAVDGAACAWLSTRATRGETPQLPASPPQLSPALAAFLQALAAVTID